MFGEKTFFGAPKTPEQLDTQLQSVQKQLGHEPEVSLVPASVEREKILQMPVIELQEKYTRRFQAYFELLRQENNPDFVSRDKLTADFKKWLIALNSLDVYVKKHHAGVDVTLRGKQIDVFDDLHNFLEAGGTAGYIKLPTGVGKTVLFTELIEALDLKTLIVVPTNILIDQTVDKAEQFAPDIEVGVINRTAKQYYRKVTVTTYASLARQVAQGLIKPEEFECLILDEAHEALSDARQKLVRKFSNAAKIGFTATPTFSAEKQLSDLLPTCIHSMETREAVEKGLLCSVSAVVAKTSVNLSKVPKNAMGDYSESELAYAVNIASRNKAAALLYKEVFSGEQAIVFCVGITHAREVARVFREEGVAAAFISGETTKDERIRLLAEFNRGEIKVLCNADLLTRGFDEPRASVCLNLRPTLSLVMAEQRGGRVLRLDPDRPDKHATVVDFVDQSDSIDELQATGQVLFAKILGGAFVVAAASGGRSWDSGGRPGHGGGFVVKKPNIYIPGLEVFFDTEEVLRIVGKVEEVKIEKSRLILDLEDLKKLVRLAKVQSQVEYLEKRVNNPSWPHSPDRLEGWVNWNDFLGKTSVETISELAVLQLAVRVAHVRNRFEYEAQRETHPAWPGRPDYLAGWTNWFDFLGKKKRDRR